MTTKVLSVLAILFLFDRGGQCNRKESQQRHSEMSVTAQWGHKCGGKVDGHGERQVLFTIFLNILNIFLWYFSAFKNNKTQTTQL